MLNTTVVQSPDYACNGATVNFNTAFEFQNNAEVVVVLKLISSGAETIQTLGVDYTLTGANVTGGGVVTMLVAPDSLNVLYVKRETTLNQPYSLRNSGNFNPANYEHALDYLAQQNQELNAFAETTRDDLDEIVGLATGPAGPAGPSAVSGATPTNYVRVAAGGNSLEERTPTQAKSDLGMANVTNTSDANKPVSTAQQTALDLKADKSPTLVQKNSAYTFVVGDNDKVFYTDDATGNWAWTVNNTVHAAGNIISGYNDKGTSGNITLTQGASFTIQWGTSTGTRTIARGGSFTLVFKTASKAYLTGSGIT